MYFKYHCQLKEGYYFPVDFRNIPSYHWLHHMMMSAFIFWLPSEQRKDCYWVLRTYDLYSFDVALRLPKGKTIEDRYLHLILESIEFVNNGQYGNDVKQNTESIKPIQISEREFLDILCHTDGRLMNVKEYVNRRGQATQDYVKPQIDLG